MRSPGAEAPGLLKNSRGSLAASRHQLIAHFRLVIAVKSNENLPMIEAPHQFD